MSTLNNKKAALTTHKAVPQIKHTGAQCKEITSKFWRWLGHENVPAIAVLPIYDEFNDNSEPWSNNPHCIDYTEIGRVSTVGDTVIAEWLYTNNRPSKSHYLFEFETAAEAQAFAKRIRAGKHLTIVAGEDCVRVVMVSSNPLRKKIRTVEDVNKSIRNTVSHIGKAMTKSDVTYHEFLEAWNYDELVARLARDHSGAKLSETPIAIGQIDNSEMFEDASDVIE